MIKEAQLIEQCKKGVSKAQRSLYEKYRTRWFMICLRYNRDREDALDVLQNALIKIYTKIDQFNPEYGSFSGWSSKIVVNESIIFLRKNIRSLQTTELDSNLSVYGTGEDPVEALSAEELTKLIQKLPDGYRLVFNMYAIEGYTHKEIAEQLGIKEGTSKSQFFKARKMLQQQIEVLI